MAFPSRVISVSLPPDLHGIGKALARHRKDRLVRIIVNGQYVSISQPSSSLHSYERGSELLLLLLESNMGHVQSYQ